jgi:hypothetical protein
MDPFGGQESKGHLFIDPYSMRAKFTGKGWFEMFSHWITSLSVESELEIEDFRPLN